MSSQIFASGYWNRRSAVRASHRDRLIVTLRRAWSTASPAMRAGYVLLIVGWVATIVAAVTIVASRVTA